jgi:hypothetical protein
MQDEPPGERLRRAEAAAYARRRLGQSVRINTLRSWPIPYRQIGRDAVYEICDLDRFIEARLAAAPVRRAPARVFSPLDQARIDKWIRDQLIDWAPTCCLHCRKPIVVGQTWTVVSNGEVSARFHQTCHGEWLERQGELAKRALGFK